MNINQLQLHNYLIYYVLLYFIIPFNNAIISSHVSNDCILKVILVVAAEHSF